MDEGPEDGEPTDRSEEAGVEGVLEALLVDDAEVSWDPVTGRPRVIPKVNSMQSSSRRRKPGLDRPRRSA